MPSEIKTENLGLNKWEGNEYPKRTDFVNDNEIIDEAIGKLESLKTENKSNIVAAVNEVREQNEDLEAEIENSFYTDLDKYYGNTKLIDDFQDISSWDKTVTSDINNVKICKQSLKLENTSAVAGLRYTDRNNSPIDLSLLNNGEISANTDYIWFVYYVSDASKLALINGYYVQINFSSAEIFDSSNRLVYTIIESPNTGWNFLKIKKSQFAIVGTATWDNIKSLRLSYNITSDATSDYVSFQLLQLIKKSPYGDYPSPFGYDFAINLGEWFVGKEFGRIVWKEIKADAFDNASLTGNKIFKNFIATKKSTVNTSGDTSYLTWFNDSANYVYAQLNNSPSKGLILFVVRGGAAEGSTVFFDYNNGDIVNITLTKNGSIFTAKAEINGKIYQTSKVKDFTEYEEGVLAVGSRNVDISDTLSASITEISHAHHADIAETAKSLTEQARCRVYSSVSQSIPSSSVVVVIFDSVRVDNRSHFELENPNLIRIRERGVYQVSASVKFNTNATGNRYIGIRKNFASSINVNTAKALDGIGTSISISGEHELQAGDALQLVAYQNSGSALDIEYAGNYSPEFSITKIG